MRKNRSKYALENCVAERSQLISGQNRARWRFWEKSATSKASGLWSIWTKARREFS